MRQFTFSFTGKQNGALGLREYYSVITEGENLQAARLALYDTHEHISNLQYLHNTPWHDIFDKAHLYATARLVSSGEYVGLNGVDTHGNFETVDRHGLRAFYHYSELYSFVL